MTTLHLTLEKLIQPREHGVHEPSRAEADRVVRRQAGLRLGRGDRGPRGVLVQARACSARSPRPSPAARAATIRSCSSTSSASDGIGKRSSSPSTGRPGLVAEHERVRRAAVDQAERDARVHRMQERALALDPEQLAAALDALDHEPLGGAGDEVGDDGVDGDPPAGDRDPGLPGRDEHASARPRRARLEVELERDGHLPDRAVGADRQDDPRRRRRGSLRSGRSAPSGGLRRSRSSTPCRAASSASSGSSADELVQAVLDVEARRDRSSSAARASAGGKRPPWVATPTSAVVGSKRERLVDGADDRDAVLGLPRALRVEHRDDLSRR